MAREAGGPAPGEKVEEKPCEDTRALLVAGRVGRDGGAGHRNAGEGRGQGDAQREETRSGDEGAGGRNPAPGPTAAPTQEAGGGSHGADPGRGSGRTDSHKQDRAQEPSARCLQPAC